MDENTKALIGQLKGRVGELSDDQMIEMVREARDEARAEAKAIIKEMMLQAELERVLEELQETRSRAGLAGETVAPMARAAPSAAQGRTGEPLRPADDVIESEEQIHQEIVAVRRRIAENERLLSQLDASPIQAEAAGEPIVEDQLSTLREGCGYYVYAIVGGDAIQSIEALPEEGIDPAYPVYSPSYRDLQAIVSKVSLQEFGQMELEKYLNDIRWVETKVRAHQAVLESVSASHTLIPMRFCTIYRSESRVQEMLAQHYDDLLEALARLAGKREWGVKLYCDRKVLARGVGEVSETLEKLRAQMAQMSSGAAYFLKKRLEETLAEEVERVSDECAQRSHDRLATHAEEVVISPLQGREFTDRKEAMLLNGAYLVAEEHLAPFRAELKGLEEEYGDLGFIYELTGPWPPYNFVSVGLEQRATNE